MIIYQSVKKRLPSSCVRMMALFCLLSFVMPKSLFAVEVELIVENVLTDPSHFTSIQSAINSANNILTENTGTTTTFAIMVEPGSYSDPITLSSNISIQGRETARTILSGSGSGAMMTATNVTNVTIKHFTFMNAGVGIQVSGTSSNFVIGNNVFYRSGTGVALQNTLNQSGVKVVNNTFFSNTTALSRDIDIQITNNLFSNNAANIVQQSSLLQTNISYNAFDPFPLASEPTGTPVIPNPAAFTSSDPLFVDKINTPPALDLHLQTGSPCINAGTNASGAGNSIGGFTSDIGAFGGPGADTIPFPVTITDASSDGAKITVSWKPNAWYLTGGYHVWYGKKSGKYNEPGDPDATESLVPGKPISVTDGSTSQTLTGLTSGVVTTLSKPESLETQPRNEGLFLSWTAVAGATGYRVYYSTAVFDVLSLSTASFIEVSNNDLNNETTYTIPDLTNGQDYYVAVSAISRDTVYIAVTAFAALDAAVATDFVPGKKYESAYSIEKPVGVGPESESTISIVQKDSPEKLLAYPDLPNGHSGCFIATAAYNDADAAPVRVLREFRDRYLVTNRVGSLFVRWYYKHSPAAAARLNAHPGYKPVVRIMLMPVVGAAYILTQSSPLFTTAIAMMLLLPAVLLAYRFRMRR